MLTILPALHDTKKNSCKGTTHTERATVKIVLNIKNTLK